MIFGGLVGAIMWNLLTWLLALPSSSSHALFGGLIGATLAFAGSGAINLTNVVAKVLIPLALSPIVAALVALAATSVAYRLAARAGRGRWTGVSGRHRWCRHRWWHWRTAPTTRRRGWA